MTKASSELSKRPSKRLSMFLNYKRILEIGVTLVFVAWLALLARWLFT